MTIRAENLTKRYRQGEKEVVALLGFTYDLPPGGHGGGGAFGKREDHPLEPPRGL